MDPYVAYYLNGLMAVILMTGASLNYNLSYEGRQDYFLYIIHLVAWG